MEPLPVGMQKSGLVKLLKEIDWSARPMHPKHTNQEGLAWLVAAQDAPEEPLVTTSAGDVVITWIRSLEPKRPKVDTTIASIATRKHCAQSSSSTATSLDDPWLKQDPWGGYRATSKPPQPARCETYAMDASDAAQTKLDEIEANLQQKMTEKLEASLALINEKQASDPWKEQMQVDLEELKQQNSQFTQWFHESSERQGILTNQIEEMYAVQSQQQGALAALSQNMQQCQVDLHNHGETQLALGNLIKEVQKGLRDDIHQQTERLERAFTGKLQRREWLRQQGPWTRPSKVLGVMSGRFCWILRLIIFWCTMFFSFRIGEAANPGPVVEELDHSNEYFCLSTSNPDGLRSRVDIVETMPWGMHGFAETQMTHQQARVFLGSLRSKRRQSGREAFMVTGSDIPTRQANSESGGWSGVAMVGHFPLRELQLTWPDMAYSTGRVVVVAMEVRGVPITGAVIYGFAHSQTHQHPGAQTDELLRVLSQELILGRGGCRFVMGDFNESRHEHPQKMFWRHRGWQEVQSAMASRGEHTMQPTCKGSTYQDQLWCSPELLQHLKKVEVADTYWPTHSVVAGFFDFGTYQQSTQSWVQPAFIPWGNVDLDSWRESHDRMEEWQWASDTTVAMREWSQRFEVSLHGHLPGHDQKLLPKACMGRSSQTEPELRRLAAPLTRPSREGEVRRNHDLLGRKVMLWFRQLRRLQSLKMSLKNRKLTDEACLYRTGLWQSILRSHGFKGGFRSWWHGRHIQLPDSPQSLPEYVPNLAFCELIYDDFHTNFRSFESTHIQSRQNALKLRLQEDEHVI